MFSELRVASLGNVWSLPCHKEGGLVWKSAASIDTQILSVVPSHILSALFTIFFMLLLHVWILITTLLHLVDMATFYLMTKPPGLSVSSLWHYSVVV